MTCALTPRSERGEPARLFREFERAYAPRRQPGMPPARRVFGFCWAMYEDRYAARLAPDEFLSRVYEVLFGAPGRGRGLLNDFDPARYRGRRGPAGHFLNMLAKRLRAGLRKDFDRASDRGQAGDRDQLPDRPEVGLCRPDRWACGDPDGRFDPDAVPDRPTPRRHGLARLVDTVPEALDTLDQVHHRVVFLKYWREWSDRRIGRDLGVDHKTAGRRLAEALDRLRAFFQQEVEEWGLGNN